MNEGLGRAGGIWLEPHVFDAPSILGATLPSLKAVEVPDRYVFDRSRIAKAEIHGDSSLSLFVDVEAVPVTDIAACCAEVEAQ